MELIIQAAESLFKNSKHNITLLSNASAFINEVIDDINWVGFYLFIDDELVLGPFQGRVACEKIGVDEGVCGYAFRNNKVTNVSDVHSFDGHIACDSRTNSELVIPLSKNNTLIGVLDIDSISYNRFDPTTTKLLMKIAKLLSKYYNI